MSGLGSTYGLILPVLQMGGLLVDNLHEQDQRLYDRLRTAHEHQFSGDEHRDLLVADTLGTCA
jgi:hypothetical protein